MLGRLGLSLLWAVGCYVAGVLIGWLLVSRFSRNTHDRSTEAGMTAFFFVGPVIGLIGFVVAFIRLKGR